MLKVSLIAVLVFISNTFMLAQKKTVAKENSLKSVTEFKQDIEKNEPKVKEAFTLFDKEGNVLEEIEYDSEGKVKTHFKYQYDANSNKIKETELNAGGKPIKITEYKYNNKHQRIEKNIYDGAGKLKSKRTYQYEYQ